MEHYQIPYPCFTTDFSVSGIDGTDFQVVHASPCVERDQTKILMPLLGKAVRNAMKARSVAVGSCYLEFPSWQMNPVILIPIHRSGHLLDPRPSVRLFAFLPRWIPESGRALLELLQQLQQFAVQQAEVLLVTTAECIERTAISLRARTALPEYCDVESELNHAANEEMSRHPGSDAMLTLSRLEGSIHCDLWPLIRYGRLPFAVGGWFKIDPPAFVFEGSVALMNPDRLSGINSDLIRGRKLWRRFSGLPGRGFPKDDPLSLPIKKSRWAQVKASLRKMAPWRSHSGEGSLPESNVSGSTVAAAESIGQLGDAVSDDISTHAPKVVEINKSVPVDPGHSIELTQDAPQRSLPQQKRPKVPRIATALLLLALGCWVYWRLIQILLQIDWSKVWR